MKSTAHRLAAVLLALSACATSSAQIGDGQAAPAAAPPPASAAAPEAAAAPASATAAPATAAKPAEPPQSTAAAAPAPAATSPSADGAAPEPDPSLIDATTGAGGEHVEPGADAEAAADPSAEETTADGLRSESLETRASGRPDHPRSLKEIISSGYIRVLTRNNDTSFFIYRGHRMGFDYEVGKKLAQRMGIRVDMVITNNWNDMVPALLRGEGDVIAAQVSVTDARKKEVEFAAPWGSTHEVIITREGAPPVATAADLSGREVHVREGSTYQESLEALNVKLKADGKAPVKIVPLPGDLETDTIIERLARGDFEYTVADENLTDIHVAFYDNISKGPAVSEERELAWAVRPGDDKLRDQISALLRELKKKPDFNVLKKKYFEGQRSFKKERKDKFYASETGTLSQYDPLIRKHAEPHGFDWRLVAAQIYQESRFDLKRKSWVGALGLFQIMPKTAKQLGITNPHDPEQSIRGGLKYMKQLMGHYDDVADDVERYRFAMAAYNSGFGHLDDARKLAREAGEDHKQWKTVSRWLLRLSKREYYSKTRFGFCRGFEPVDYVRHIDERYAGYAQLVPLKKPASASRE